MLKTQPDCKANRLMHRLLTLLLISSVLLCTFSCTTGRCCAVDATSKSVSRPVETCCRKCQREAKTSTQRPERSNSTTPDGSPSHHGSDCCNCQGACSGMVGSKPVELKAAFTSVFFSWNADHTLKPACSSVFLRASADDLPERRMNHGLSMRVLVCSLTC